MSRARIDPDFACYQHVTARANGQLFYFEEDASKKMAVDLLYRVADFSGIEILEFCMMNNHIHLLIHVVGYTKVSEKELLRRYRVMYGRDAAEEMRDRWKTWTKQGPPGLEKKRKEMEWLRNRMGRISKFMQLFLQLLSRRYNKGHGRVGGLWQSRFYSEPVEAGEALRGVALYIGANPFRAGIVESPELYPWSGIGMAYAGSKTAMKGIWSARASDKESTSPKRAMLRQVLDYKKSLHSDCPLGRFLRGSFRCLMDGAALGSREFVEKVFHSCRDRFGAARKTGARKIRGCEALKDFFILRDLRKNLSRPMEEIPPPLPQPEGCTRVPIPHTSPPMRT